MQKDKSSSPNYDFVSEFTHHYYPDEDGLKLTEKQAKLLVYTITIVFFGLIVFILLGPLNDTVKGDQLSSQEVQLNAIHDDLVAEADKLCSVRIDSCICDDVIEADDFIASYKFTKSGNEWTSNNGNLSFSDGIISFTPAGSSSTLSYTCEALGDYYVKFNDVASFSEKDMKALGRVLVGVYDDFH